MKFCEIKSVLVALVVASVPTMAQAETLTEALASAYANNPNIASAMLSVKASAEDVALRRSGKLPTIAATVDATHSWSVTSGVTTSGDTITAGLGYQHRLFDNFKTDAQIEQASAYVDVSRHALRNAEQNVLLSVVSSYVGVIRDTQLTQLRQDNVVFFKEQVKSAEQRKAAGSATSIEVSQAKARMAQAVASYQSAVSGLKVSQAGYERWVGHRPQRLSINHGFDSLVPGSIDAALNAATTSHPAIMSAKAALRASQANSDAARAAFGPTLDLIGSLCAINCFGSPNTQGMSGSVRLTLSIPIYAGGAMGAGARKANLEQIRSEVDVRVAYDQVREAVISSWSTLQNANAQIDAARSAVSAAQAALDGVVAERDVGQRTTLDVLNARAEYTTVQEALIGAVSSRAIATFSLLAATGELSATKLRLPVSINAADGYTAAVQDVWQELRSVE